jgi:hypothetical protein
MTDKVNKVLTLRTHDRQSQQSVMCLNIVTIKRIKDGPPVTKLNWCIMVEERINLKFSSFYETKGRMVVKYIRLDNAGENKKLKTHSDSADGKLNIDDEFTSKDTLQQNHLAELGFATVANRGRVVMLL